MSRQTLGKSLISFVLVTSAVISVAVDWNTSHVFNPGVPVYPNVVVGIVSLALNALGYGLYRSARRLE